MRIYSFGQNSIFVFEYWIFGEQYSNIRIYSNIRPTLEQLKQNGKTVENHDSNAKALKKSQS